MPSVKRSGANATDVSEPGEGVPEGAHGQGAGVKGRRMYQSFKLQMAEFEERTSFFERTDCHSKAFTLSLSLIWPEFGPIDSALLLKFLFIAGGLQIDS